jgi:hypothetical protein
MSFSYFKRLYKTNSQEEKYATDIVCNTKLKIFILWTCKEKSLLLLEAEKGLFRNCYARQHLFKSKPTLPSALLPYSC